MIRRHVGLGAAVPLHPIASGFAGHHGFDIDVLVAYRPTGKGRVERQVKNALDHVLGGRLFRCLAEADKAFEVWVPIRRAQVHRTLEALLQDNAAALLDDDPARVTASRRRCLPGRTRAGAEIGPGARRPPPCVLVG